MCDYKLVNEIHIWCDYLETNASEKKPFILIRDQVYILKQPIKYNDTKKHTWFDPNPMLWTFSHRCKRSDVNYIICVGF